MVRLRNAIIAGIEKGFTVNTGKRKDQKASRDEPRSIRYGMRRWVLGNNLSRFDPRSPSLFVFPTTSYATTNNLLVLIIAWVVAKLKRLQGVPLSLIILYICQMVILSVVLYRA